MVIHGRCSEKNVRVSRRFTPLNGRLNENQNSALETSSVLSGPNSNGMPVNGRCGPGVRTPLLVISPWAKQNYVDHTFTTQTSITRFIEDNWSLGQIGGG